MARDKNNLEKKENHQLDKTPVAIIGMASIFPQAHNLQEYWDNILNKVNCITEVPASRWDITDYYDPDPSKPDKSYCKRGGFIPDIDFDPTEFGLPPNILEVTDVSQLLSLVVARDALEDAGYGEGKDFNRVNTGVILGAVGVGMKLYVPLMARLQYPVWQKVLKASGVSDADTERLIEKFKLAYVKWEENSFPGSLSNVIAGRIANRFDLGGTNCVLDAACATSMAAFKMAVMELVEGRMDMMITGGVDTDNSIGVYMSFSKTPAFSKGEAVRSFDAESDGMMAGEGLGMMVLKRLADAERDGDRIYAVIRGIGSSSDGRYKSIYAPRPSGQAIAIRRTYEEAGYEPSTVGLVEAHGTGTPAGDPSEFEGLNEVFSVNHPEHQTIALGSVKSQIAHTKGTAGAAGLIKAAMALHHKILPATINVKTPNPKFNIENTPFYINTETRPWFRQTPSTPRRASVSAFGFGGTNFHVTLEEYQNDHDEPYRSQTVPQMVLLSAPNRVELTITIQDTIKKLRSDTAGVFYNQLVGESNHKTIPLENARLGFVAGSPAETIDFLTISSDQLQKHDGQNWEHPKGIYYRQSGVDPKGKVVSLFSGQGSQYLEMGRELVNNFPPMRQVISALDALFIQENIQPLSRRIFPPPVFNTDKREQLSAALTRTENAQPAIGAVSMGMYKLLQQAGFQTDFAAGHSFGELTALWAAGVINDQDYLFLAKARGQAMAAPDSTDFDAGSMLAVMADASRVVEEIKSMPDITLANWNSNNQVILAGSKTAIAEAQNKLKEKGYAVSLLPVSAAFHTSLVKHAQKPFAAALNKVSFNNPTTRLFSNSSGKEYSPDAEKIRRTMSEHVLKPVLFKDEIEAIYGEGGQIFVEFGPKGILTNLVKDILGNQPFSAIAINPSPKKDSDRQMREAVVQLKVLGLPLTGFDPYQAALKLTPVRKLSMATVKLNGSNYVSAKTKAAFENSLIDGFKVRTASAVPNLAVNPDPQPPIPTPTPQPVFSTPLKKDSKVMNSLDGNLAQFHQHQEEVARLHELYLKNEESYSTIFARLSEMEMNLLTQAAPDQMERLSVLFGNIEASMNRFHDHQAETQRIHSAYLKSQEEYSRNYTHLVGQQFEMNQDDQRQDLPPSGPSLQKAPAPTPIPVQPKVIASAATQPAAAALPVTRIEIPTPAGAPSPSPVQSAYDVKMLTETLLKVVSEKTGYPVEMLDLNTDMEADLGIDSIKRVEIMGAMRELFPNLPKVDPESFSQVHTLGQTVTYMVPSQPAGSLLPAPAGEIQTSGGHEATSIPAVPQEGTAVYNPDVLTKTLLEVVSEKTGYPVEMLDLNTDMEADLGIDSIKRVEIMGAMREQFPNLPKVDSETFAEVHTLGQTVAYMSPARVESQVIPTSKQSPVIKNAPAFTENAGANPTVPGPDSSVLQKALLKTVSEKTGYPVEMLDLNTDMESELGIDSIKRVEIMGALREQFPNLPKVGPESFAEVHTLRQIMTYMEPGKIAASEKISELSKAAAEQAPISNITRGVVNLKSLPEPDFASFNLPENHICLLTDDGTSGTASLAEELLKRNWKVVVLSFPTSLIASQEPLPEGIQRVTLADLSEEHLQKQLDDISARFGPVAALVHLNPSAAIKKNGHLFSKTQIEIIKYVFLLAKHLKEPLTAAAKEEKSVFMAVVRMDGEFGLGNKIDFDPISGGLFGLVKTLNLEWESVYCRAVDISPDIDNENATRHIIAELHDPNRLITEVAYHSLERSTLVIDNSLPGQVK